MNNNINKKSILIAIVIVMIGLLITGGTYAYFSIAAGIANGNYVTNTHCFNVSYTFDDDPVIEPNNMIESVDSYPSGFGNGGPTVTVSNGVYTYTGSGGGDMGYLAEKFVFNLAESIVSGEQYTFTFNLTSNCDYKDYAFSEYDASAQFLSSSISQQRMVDGINSYTFTAGNNSNTGYFLFDLTVSGTCSLSFSNFKLYEASAGNLNGTLFPSSDAYGGVYAGVNVVSDASCGLTGTGTLKMHVNSGTSNALTNVVAAHCENEKTLETISEYTTQSACTAVTGNKWVTDGTALKYAVFIGNDLNNSGYIKTANIGNDITIHDNFSVTTTVKKVSAYVWLDGRLTSDTYYDLDFNSSVRLETAQAKSTAVFTGDTPLVDGYLSVLRGNNIDIKYQKVEYIQSTGTQYIDTGYVPNQKSKMWLDYQPTSAQSKMFAGCRNESLSPKVYFTINSGSNSTKMYASWGATGNYTIDNMTTDRVITQIGADGIYYNEQLKVTPTESNWSGLTYSVYLFAVQQSTGVASLNSNVKIYGCKIYDDSKLVRDFVPCYRKIDGKPGMYDVVNGVFYTNAASSGDDFTIGSNID